MRYIAVLLTVLALVTACGRSKSYVNISHSPVQVRPRDYEKFYRRWTRHRTIIQQFDTTLKVYATLLSWEFRWAYTVAMARMFRLTEGAKKDFWASQQKELGDHIDFIVSAASSNTEWNDLEKGSPEPESPGKPVKRSLWRVTLEVDEADGVLPSVIRVVEPISKLHKIMFPHIGHFHRLYLVRFPRTINGRETIPAAAREIRLRFAGSLGNVRLIWQTTNFVVPD